MYAPPFRRPSQLLLCRSQDADTSNPWQAPAWKHATGEMSLLVELSCACMLQGCANTRAGGACIARLSSRPPPRMPAAEVARTAALPLCVRNIGSFLPAMEASRLAPPFRDSTLEPEQATDGDCF